MSIRPVLSEADPAPRADLNPSSPSTPAAQAAPANLSVWQLLAAAALTFAVWRGALFCFDLLGLSLTPGMGRCRKQWQVFGAGHELLNGFFRWDAGWYLQIAKRGYSYNPAKSSSVAFYPLFPMLARYLGKVTGGHAIAGLIIANLGAIGAIYFMRRIAAQLFDDKAGKLAVILLLVFPTSLFISSYYTEGLFLCLSAGSMYFYFQRRFFWCGCLGFLAMLTRSTGLVLFLALAFDLAWQLYRQRERFAWRMLWLLAIPAGLGAFMLFQELRFGEPFAFAKTLEHWGRRGAWPWQTLWSALTETDYTFPPNAVKTQRFIDAVTGVVFLSIGALMVRFRQPVALWSYVLIGTLLPLGTHNIAGMNRYVLVLFPAFLFVAKLCEGRRELERWLIFASAFFLAVYSLRFMQCGWVG